MGDGMTRNPLVRPYALLVRDADGRETIRTFPTAAERMEAYQVLIGKREWEVRCLPLEGVEG